LRRSIWASGPSRTSFDPSSPGPQRPNVNWQRPVAELFTLCRPSRRNVSRRGSHVRLFHVWPHRCRRRATPHAHAQRPRPAPRRAPRPEPRDPRPAPRDPGPTPRDPRPAPHAPPAAPHGRGPPREHDSRRSVDAAGRVGPSARVNVTRWLRQCGRVTQARLSRAFVPWPDQNGHCVTLTRCPGGAEPTSRSTIRSRTRSSPASCPRGHLKNPPRTCGGGGGSSRRGVVGFDVAGPRLHPPASLRHSIRRSPAAYAGSEMTS
jgi:hypothetical protein